MHAALLLLLHWTALQSVAVSCNASKLRSLRASVPIANPDYNIYHRKKDLLHKVEEVVRDNPRIMRLDKLSAADKNYNISMQVVQVDMAGLDSSPSQKARVLLDFGEHAREFISSEVGLRLLQTLANPAATAALVGGGERGAKLLELLQHVTFKILPMENEQGRDLVEQGRLCERKNGRGVDPNRNWAVDWGKKEKDYDPQEEYPGTAPFSEPEARIVLALAQEFKPHVWVNVHSGMEAMFTPWDHKDEVPAAAQEALQFLHIIKHDLFSSQCVVGSGGKSVGYLAHGTATDYMFERLKVPLSYTWEIYGDMQASFHDCFRMFNPLTREHVQSVTTLWLKALLRLVELLPSHSAIKQEQVFNTATAGAADNGSGDSNSSSSSSSSDSARREVPQSGSPVVTGSSSIETADIEKGGGDVGIEQGSVDSRPKDGNFVLVAPLHVLQHGSAGMQAVLVLSCIAFVGACVIMCAPSLSHKVAATLNWKHKRPAGLLPITAFMVPTAGTTRP